MCKQDLLVYDKTWGGVVTKDGLNDRNADFGNAWYNDHTYHYGYLLYAAAVLIKFRPAFYDAHKEQLDFLLADVVGGEGDTAKLFPSARQKVSVRCRLIPPLPQSPSKWPQSYLRPSTPEVVQEYDEYVVAIRVGGRGIKASPLDGFGWRAWLTLLMRCVCVWD